MNYTSNIKDKKILFVIDSLGSGGAQKQIVTLACGLKERGYDVGIYVYHYENHFMQQIQDKMIPIYIYHKQYRMSIMPIIYLRRIIIRNQYNVVVSFLDTPNLYSEIARINKRDYKLIVSERYYCNKFNLKKIIMCQFHRMADAITTNSHNQTEILNDKFKWMKVKSKTIYNGYDLNIIKPTLEVQDKRKTGLNLIAIASASYNKNSINLAKAIIKCNRDYGIDVNLDWFGTKYISGCGNKCALETDGVIKAGGIENKWKWMGETKNIIQEIMMHDALIHPSFSEGLPNVVCETLACGRPVLVSRVCDHENLVEEGKRGYLFEPNNPEDIANAILKLWKLSQKDIQQMCFSARKYAENNLSIEKYLDEYEKTINLITK